MRYFVLLPAWGMVQGKLRLPEYRTAPNMKQGSELTGSLQLLPLRSLPADFEPESPRRFSNPALPFHTWRRCLQLIRHDYFLSLKGKRVYNTEKYWKVFQLLRR